MLKGIHLTLLIGPVVAAPVPRELTEALVSAQVTTSAGQRSGFQLQFVFGKSSTIGRTLLPVGFFDPGIRVILGEDISLLMDLADATGFPYPAMPPEARVALIVGKYAACGMIPVIIPSVFIDVPIPTQEIPVQQGNDLQYIKKLADDAGYVFYIEPGPAPGTNLAYWGPEMRIGVPQPALNVNFDAHTNVESISFSQDGLSREQPFVFIHEPLTHLNIPVPIPDVGLLRPPLAARPAMALKSKKLEIAHLPPVRAALHALAHSARSPDAVTGTGSLNVLRYGRVLKARQLVGVRGASPAFDGLFYVKSVTHNLKAGEYKQSFTLAREGLGSLLRAVPA